MTNETLNVIKARSSIRAFKPDRIDDAILRIIVEAGNYAPYAQEGSRHFTVIQNEGILRRLNAIAKEAALTIGMDHLEALGKDLEFDSVHHAPSLVIVSGNEGTVAPETDCAAAAENIVLAAESLDIGSCWIFFVLLAFYSPQCDGLKKELQIPTEYKPYASVALGYSADKQKATVKRDMRNITYIR